MKTIYSILLLLALLFSGNSFSQNFITETGGNCYSIEIPNYMAKTYDLNDVASAQYKNTLKEAYTIVIEDSKDELKSLSMLFIDSKDFLENFIKDYQIDAKDRTISEITEFKSNENQHAQVEMTWNDDAGKYYMLITSVETETHFFKILCWTLLEYKDKLRNDFLTISKSIKD